MFTPLLGLAYLAGALPEAGFAVQMIDAVGDSFDTHRRALDDCYYYGLSSAATVDSIEPDCPIVGIAFGFSFKWTACRDLAAVIWKSS